MATVTGTKRHLGITSNTYDSNGDVVVGGNLTVEGTTTTLDTANLLVEDKNIIIGNVSSPSDTTADGGGITLKGASDYTINWVNANNRWEFNQGIYSSGPITSAGQITGTELEGTSLDINGNADISGVLTLSKSNGSLIATTNTTDAFGYNATAGKGHYIKGTAATYIYGGGTFYDGTTTHTLLHDGSTISTSQITNLSGTNTGDQDLSGYSLTSHNHDDRYYTETEVNNLLSNKTELNHLRSLGTPAFTGTATTAGLISEMESDGAFDSYSSVFKTSWSYSGNFNLGDAGRFTETAGSSWITWTDNSSDSTRGNITALAIAPNTGGSAGKVFIYNDQGSSYSPGWREVWTSTSDGAGSGLDADLLDGLHASSFALSTVVNQTDFVSAANGGTFSGDITINGDVLLGGSSQDPKTITIQQIGATSTETTAIMHDGNGVLKTRNLSTGAFGPTPVGAYLPIGGGILTGDLTVDNTTPRIDFKSDQSGTSVGGRIELNENGNLWVNAQGGKDLWLNWYSPNSESSKADLAVGDGDSGAAILFVDGSERKVGIGTTTPRDTLEIVGNIRFVDGEDHLMIKPNSNIHGADFIVGDGVAATDTPVMSLNGLYGGQVTIQTQGTTTTNKTVLDVQGTQGQLFSVTDDLTGDLFTVSDISGVPIFNVNASGTSYFDDKVGIGTTSPTSLLEISQQLSAASTIDYPYTISSRDDGNLINQAGGEGVGIKFRIAGNDSGTPGDSLIGASIAAIRESSSDTDSSTGLGFFITQNDETLDEALRIDHDGKVGIGTTNPSYKLDVHGDGIALGAAAFAKYDSNNDLFLIGDWDGAGADMAIYDGNTSEVVRIANGKVGIGTTNPTYKLDVAGTIRATGDVLAFSDRRVKENIKTIENASDKLLKLRGVEYNKIGETKKSIGVIAQEIEEVLPEVVSTDTNGMKSVAYGNITGVLIEAIKELKAEIEELKKQIK